MSRQKNECIIQIFDDSNPKAIRKVLLQGGLEIETSAVCVAVLWVGAEEAKQGGVQVKQIR